MALPNRQEAEILLDAQGDFLESGKTEKNCPRCGKHLLHEEGKNWEVTRCEVIECIGLVSKGV